MCKEAVDWYQTPEIQRMVNGTSAPFTRQQVVQMYAYQARHGKLWYIQYQGKIVGDFSISDAQEIAIVLGQDYQGLGIGTAVLQFFIKQRNLAREQKTIHEQHFPQVRRLWAKIFVENQASQRLFLKCGFTCVEKLTERGREYLKFVLQDS